MALDLSPSQDNERLPLQDWEGAIDLDNEAYHALEGYISSSTLKLMIKSPAHFKSVAIDGYRKTSDSFDFGSCAHEMVLEGDDTQFVGIPDFKPQPKLTKKKQVEDFKLHHPGKRFVTMDQVQALKAMFRVAKSNKVAAELLAAEGNVVEHSYLYLDEKTGMKCKFRPDVMNIGEGFIVDYKTCEDASPHAFRKAIARYYYHISAIHYLVGSARLFGDVIKDYYFIAQEKSPPYAVGVYKLDHIVLKRAAKMRRELLVRVRDCIGKNNFPDYTEKGIQLISPPDYAFELE